MPLTIKQLRPYFATGNKTVGYAYKCRKCNTHARNVSEMNSHLDVWHPREVDGVFPSTVSPEKEIHLSYSNKVTLPPETETPVPLFTAEFVEWLVNERRAQQARIAYLENQLTEFQSPHVSEQVAEVYEIYRAMRKD